MKFSQFMEMKDNQQTPSPPPVLYHGTSMENRQSILTHGLKPADLGAVFLSTKPPQPSPQTAIDIWAVDVKRLKNQLEEDFNDDPETLGYWWAYYGTIPTSRLKLFRAANPK